LTSKKIYLVRHGQTDFNLQGIVQGSGIDSSLNERGRAQAAAFHKAYADVKFDRIYTSALKRTVQTVQPFIDAGTPFEQLAGLNEISWGSKEGQKITVSEDAYYHWMLKQWQEGKTQERIVGGESPEDVALRQGPAIEHIMERRDEQNILVCMHGRAMRILLCRLLNYPLRAMDTFEHENLCLYLLHHTGTMFIVEKFNHTKHLDLMPPEVKILTAREK
jgi:broad specificity phosphatase PhoE